MKNKQAIFFLVNLNQDVNILRPLVYLAARLDNVVRILLMPDFPKRDYLGQWYEELCEISYDTSATLHQLQREEEAVLLMNGMRGCVVAGSESNLRAHSPTHNIFAMAPEGFLTITLQHGYECVGFLQSEQHNLVYGESVTLGADVVCGWFDASFMKQMVPSQVAKLVVTGPSSLLQQPSAKHDKPQRGLVCENLHSVRLNASGDFKQTFIDVFQEFCGEMRQTEEPVVLRPHPGGQYVMKNNIPLPENAEIENRPIYKVDLTSFSYGISAPSSILLDLVLAGVPVAVWQDEAAVIDCGHYAGLAVVSNLSDWLEFAWDAVNNPEKYRSIQKQFLERIGLQANPEIAFRRFSSLLNPSIPPGQIKDNDQTTRRVMFVSADIVPTLQLSFIKPLQALEKSGAVVTDFITEKQLTDLFRSNEKGDAILERLAQIDVTAHVATVLQKFTPDMIVFCRYQGPQSVFILQWAKQHDVPVVYHIDDDLLHLPRAIGDAKFEHNNNPIRIRNLRYLLDHANLVYCSTPNLRKRLTRLKTRAMTYAGKVYCSGEILNAAEERPVRVIGYMASRDHVHNLLPIVPVLVQLLEKNQNLKLEFFGSIEPPEELTKFGDKRVSICPPVKQYDKFLEEFAGRGWDIGLCPLAPEPFNLMKANTKWVEYSSCGVAVVAQAGTVYDECGSGGGASLVDGPEEWMRAIQDLIDDPELRFRQVLIAQQKITREYSVDVLREQVLDVFELAKSRQKLES